MDMRFERGDFAGTAKPEGDLRGADDLDGSVPSYAAIAMAVFAAEPDLVSLVLSVSASQVEIVTPGYRVPEASRMVVRTLLGSNDHVFSGRII